MPYELASILGIGSVVRLGHDPTDAYCLDGEVTDIADGVATVWFIHVV
jgi:hypothetical protein